MIPLVNKANVDTSNPDYPLGKLINDTGTGDGTPVDEQVYNDLHQLTEKIMAESGISPNNQPDNANNGYQLYEALQAIVANGFPHVSAGAWIDGLAPTVSCDTGTAAIFSTLNNRYKIVGKTFIWEFRGSLTISSGSPGRVSFTYPVALAQKNFNSLLPTKGRGYYKTGEVIFDLQATTIDFRPVSPVAFNGSAQYFMFQVTMELV